jgi:hypothetical protein
VLIFLNQKKKQKFDDETRKKKDWHPKEAI